MIKPTNYSNFCKKIFGNIVKEKNKIRAEEKNLTLIKADIYQNYDEYYSMGIMSSILSFIISFIIFLILYLIFPNNITLYFLIFLPILITFSAAVTLYYLPAYQIKRRGRNIDLFLPYAINFISSMAVAGISPAKG